MVKMFNDSHGNAKQSCKQKAIPFFFFFFLGNSFLSKVLTVYASSFIIITFKEDQMWNHCDYLWKKKITGLQLSSLE